VSDRGQREGVGDGASASREVARFEVRLWRCLDVDGNALAPLPAFAGDLDHLRRLYRAMVRVRTLDARAVALQRTGQLGTYASSLGQEAVGAALGDALSAADVLLPTYRETLALLLRGVAMREILLYWGGDERGMDFAADRGDFPHCIPIGTQVTHAVGVAAAFHYRREPRVAVCVVGDGGTSRGDFYEGINLAGAWSLPVVFLVVNNQWAISVPRARQSGAETLAQKALAAGFGGEQVDGNDVVMLRERLSLAVERARRGEGPHLIEALTYRLADHTTADDASRYRPGDEVEHHRQREPVLRLRRYLTRLGAWDEAQEAECLAHCAREVEAEVAAYLATPPAPATAMFDHLYEALPAALAGQRRELAEKGASAPGAGDHG